MRQRDPSYKLNLLIANVSILIGGCEFGKLNYFAASHQIYVSLVYSWKFIKCTPKKDIFTCGLLKTFRHAALRKTWIFS